MFLFGIPKSQDHWGENSWEFVCAYYQTESNVVNRWSKYSNEPQFCDLATYCTIEANACIYFYFFMRLSCIQQRDHLGTSAFCNSIS